MQYVRSLGSGVSKTWNSINPATLSGAIDVIVIEQEDGSLACSPFHVRFGKFSLLRPFEKKVEFKVNGVKQNYAMKLGEGGEAFFVFETTDAIPEALQTSPLISPANSPPLSTSGQSITGNLTEPTYLDITEDGKVGMVQDQLTDPRNIPIIRREGTFDSDHGDYGSFPGTRTDPHSNPWLEKVLTPPPFERAASDLVIPVKEREEFDKIKEAFSGNPIEKQDDNSSPPRSPASPPSLKPQEALDRAMTLSKKLSSSNIQSQVTESGDLMLDMTGYKSSEEDALRAEAIARKILSEELEGNYDIGSLIGTDEHGNLWIYSSEEAKDAANRRAAAQSMAPIVTTTSDTVSDPGYHSDSDQSLSPNLAPRTHQRAQSEDLTSVPRGSGEQGRSFAKTLRLTSDQLKQLELKPGANPISFTVNRATCQAFMYYWTVDVPIVISDIDGTITKSDALGHLFNMVGRDWTHLGVAKLYSDIVANGYNILYLTSRSVGQADTTRTYLNGVTQEGWKLPKGPVIMSPDRTIAALRREIYLRKPEVFKMACLRDIFSLFPGKSTPFYAGFGNRLTDALSYRAVNIPSSRIFTINSNAEVSLDLLSLNKYKSSYVTMREIVDHFFPPVSTLVKEGGEEYTDFTYWRDTPQNLDDFIPTDSEDGEDDDDENDEYEEEYEASVHDLDQSFISHESVEQSAFEGSLVDSIDGSIADELANARGEAEYVDDYLDESPRATQQNRSVQPLK